MNAEDATNLAKMVADRAALVRARITAAGGSTDMKLLAVTKGFGPDAVSAALEAGLTDVGENYAQELIEKAAVMSATRHDDGASDDADGLPEPRWHFIGRLQRNKVRHLAPLVTLWQTVDRLELIDELARRAPNASVLIQINLSEDPNKGGCTFTQADAFIDHARTVNLDVQGLMGVGPAGPPEAARPGFRALVAIADRYNLPVRSIGMSADLEVAVQEGSTMVRVGQGLFGQRPVRT
ncbi:MAG: YggS family pyridoxal phosphate-dependent enzyme [Actinomycetes bacterium]